MTDKILWIAKRFIIAGMVAVTVVTSVAGCAKKEEEDFEFSESGLEEKYGEVAGGTDTTQGETEDQKEENQGGEVTEPDQSKDTVTDTTPTDTNKQTDGSNTQDGGDQKSGEDADEPTDGTDTTLNKDTTDQKNPDEETQVDETKPDEETDPPAENTVAVPDISAVAMMNSEQALTELTGVPFQSLKAAWQANLESHDESARFGSFRVDAVTIQLYYDGLDQIVSVTVETDEADEPDEEVEE